MGVCGLAPTSPCALELPTFLTWVEDHRVRIKNPYGSYTRGWLRFQVYFWSFMWLLVLANLIVSSFQGNGRQILGSAAALILGALGITFTYREWRAVPRDR